MMTSPRQLMPKSLTLAAHLLCCPDCRTGVSSSLNCSHCDRSFLPQDDGIIDALPSSMRTTVPGNPDDVQALIETTGPGDHGQNIVLYEKAFHDQQASYYDKMFADPQPLASYYKHLVRDQIWSLVQNEPFVIDLCCGTGKSSLPLLERGLPVIGMDVSRRMLQIYRRKSQSQDLLLIHADASRPPLRSQSCRAIMMIGGLHHITDQAGCVEVCCEALHPGGVFIVHEPLKTGRSSRFSRILENVYALLDPGRVRTAIRRRIGLSVAKPDTAPEAEPDFTPYERPFSSPDALAALLPHSMKSEILKSQGLLSFREFPQSLQKRWAVPLAALVVRYDDHLSNSPNGEWSGDALFAVFRKQG